MLESFKHAKCAFVTLTYDEEHYPTGGSLLVSDPQKFLKRLRKAIAPQKIRHYYCGEYGEKYGRPHYHLAIFGLGPEDEETINKAWGRGDIHVGDLTHDSAQYVAQYVTKKMNHPESKCNEHCTHPPLLGRRPEFSRMSLRPGIGASTVRDIADTLTTPHGCDALAEVGDVPHHLILERKQIPLGKYLRGKLRETLGFPEKNTPKESLDAWKAEMQKLRKDFIDEKGDSTLSKYLDKTQHFKSWLIEKNAQKVLQIETKNRIYGSLKDKL